MKHKLEITDEHALELGKKMGMDISDESIIHQTKELVGDVMYIQTNIRGVDWLRAFEYLKSKEYDLSIFEPKKFI